MRKILSVIVVAALSLFVIGCDKSTQTVSSTKETRAVEMQQNQYQIGQPIPTFDWSLERHLMIELYKLRNKKVATHAVWRSDYGLIEGDCPSLGYGLPYDTSLTNPLVATDIDQQGEEHSYQGGALASVEQPEPNGVFASKNTAATWVMCTGDGGGIEPVYVESKVTIYPGPVKVDYKNNRVTRSGAATVNISRD